MKTTSKLKQPKNEEDLKKSFCPPPTKKEYYLIFFSWPLTWTATRQLILNRKYYQVSKKEKELHMVNIIYAALLMRAQTEKTTFSYKDD